MNGILFWQSVFAGPESKKPFNAVGVSESIPITVVLKIGYTTERSQKKFLGGETLLREKRSSGFVGYRWGGIERYWLTKDRIREETTGIEWYREEWVEAGRRVVREPKGEVAQRKAKWNLEVCVTCLTRTIAAGYQVTMMGNGTARIVFEVRKDYFGGGGGFGVPVVSYAPRPMLWLSHCLRIMADYVEWKSQGLEEYMVSVRFGAGRS